MDCQKQCSDKAMENFESGLTPAQSSPRANRGDSVFKKAEVPVRAQTAKAKRSAYHVSRVSTNSVAQVSTGYSKQE